MNPRFLGKVLTTPDAFTVVVNIGDEHGVRQGQEFLVIGLGETISDPDTGEVLEQLEIVRGKVVATHVQKKISTLVSADTERDPDIKEVKRKPLSVHDYTSIFGERESVTEIVKLGAQRKKALLNAKAGDHLMPI